MSAAPAIAVTGLTKSFGGRVVVDHVSLEVGQGRVCGFLGPNGSGKTTTLRMICGLLIPDSGSGTVLGLDLATSRGEIKRRIGYMTQRFGLFEDLTIRENLAFVADAYSLDNKHARVDAALDRLGLATRADQLAGKLSGGWKQRLALAACVLHEPQILLLDEPTAGVDPLARREFWDQIHVLAAEGVTVLVSTHYMDEAERCHDIAYIAYGVLLARGTAAEIVRDSGLAALTGEGPGADRLAPLLQQRPGVTMAAAFGPTLHIAGPDLAALRAAVKDVDPAIDWREAEPTLEDVFIHLMRSATDNSVGIAS
ncbi:ABC transporter ATP-binding protein [Sphingomonas sp. LB-2]|uniref:ABC transporter ATP-binding protein n=1 Tax=Sphingomonas caeni TaxID=2984949 RepID=UPI002231AD26|nr:ABC transporter ATP-binding protein [Sphingomonas caeni]MCW3847862.1 ABC transporter ATP-binding protein [Sphingomonas caeni]